MLLVSLLLLLESLASGSALLLSLQLLSLHP